jgi:gas vesicle protein
MALLRSPAAIAAGGLLKISLRSRRACLKHRLGLPWQALTSPYFLRSLKMKTGWAFLAGLGVGTVATLMLAPQSGKDTQKLLAGKFRDGVDQVTSAGKKVSAQVKDVVNRRKENVAEALDTGKEAYRTSVSGG